MLRNVKLVWSLVPISQVGTASNGALLFRSRPRVNYLSVSGVFRRFVRDDEIYRK